MRKVYLVTGVAGFIGAKTAEFLLKDGAEVIGVDNLNDYYDVGIKKARLDVLKQLPGFRFEEIDIENLEGLDALFKEQPLDAVFNLAARAGVRYSMENPHVYMSTNAQGSLNVLECMRHHGVKKLVLASTSSLYAGQPMPFREDLPVNTPISPYAASKKAAEAMAYAYHNLYGIDVSVVRYFTVYGPMGRPDMCIYRFVNAIAQGKSIKLFGDGTQSRDFTYVDDIARGTILALKEVGYEVFNLGGGGEPVSLNTVIASLERLLGKEAIIEYEAFHKADIKVTQADVSKAKRMLGWEPEVSIEDGLVRVVEAL